MWIIFRKEINEFLNNLIGYIVLLVFLTSVGIVMWLLPQTSLLDYGFATMEPLFTMGPYLFLFLIPAITMRSFAEEKRNGTLELLLTLPLTRLQILYGKFLASWVLVIISLVPTLVYYLSVYLLGSPEGNLDTPGIIGSYIGIILLAGVFTSVGLFCSLVSGSQIVSFVLAVCSCFILYQGFDLLSGNIAQGDISIFIEKLGIAWHYDQMGKGVIQSADLAYFSMLLVFFMSISYTSLAGEK